MREVDTIESEPSASQTVTHRLDDIGSDRTVDVRVGTDVADAVGDGPLGDLRYVRFDVAPIGLSEGATSVTDHVDPSRSPLVVPRETIAGRRKCHVEAEVRVDEPR